ncbi:MAG: SpoVA/SpoVAEb family sporulation membrane protein [Clostridiales bacterium]|jgi:stage V sporulation protein AC|nr:SpoVA/SpoVAEb family sporulation membrane protein [Clostridiales bacterium]
MKMTKREYMAYVGDTMPKSPHAANLLRAFITGGLICCVGQGLANMFYYFNLSIDDASAATSVVLIGAASLLTGLDLYGAIGKFGGAGSLVPITGFANSIVSAALEFKSEGFVLGMCAKMFTLAGPVLVFGFSASVIYGLILFFSGVR